MSLSHFSTEQLLAEIVRRKGHTQGPDKMTFHYPPRQTVIGIGKNNHAEVVMCEDDLRALQQRTEGEV